MASDWDIDWGQQLSGQHFPHFYKIISQYKEIFQFVQPTPGGRDATGHRPRWCEPAPWSRSPASGPTEPGRRLVGEWRCALSPPRRPPTARRVGSQCSPGIKIIIETRREVCGVLNNSALSLPPPARQLQLDKVRFSPGHVRPLTASQTTGQRRENSFTNGQ